MVVSKMYNVNNKKAIRNISIKSFFANKTRNIVAIIAIALTALMFTSVFTIGSVIIHSFEQSNFMQVGGYSHGSIKDVSYEDIEILSKHPLIESYGVSRVIGTITDGPFAKFPAEIKYTDDNYQKSAYADLIAGTIPKENTNEIICDTNVLKTLDVEPIIGTEINLTYEIFGKKITDNFILSGYFEPNSVLQIGFIYTARSYADNLALKYPTQMNQSTFGRIDMSLLLEDSNSIEKNIIKIIKDSGYQSSDKTQKNYLDYGVNWGYVSAQASNTFDFGTILFTLILILLFMLSGYLIIFNIFKISVSNDVRFYGLLKTIGTTNKQIKKIIKIQGVLLSLVGIPIGLLLGFILGSFVAPAVISTLNVNVVSLTINLYIFIGGALFSLVTVIFSVKKPARLASHVSPVEAVKYTDSSLKIMGNKKSRKTTPFNMAMANMKRSKGKTFIVISSLSLAILVLQMSFMFTNGFSMDKYLKYFSVSDFLIGNAKYINDDEYFHKDISLSEQDIAFISSLDGVDNSAVVYGKPGNTYVFSDMSRLEESLSLNTQNTSPEKLSDIKDTYLKMGTNKKGQVLMRDTFYVMDDFALEKLTLVEGRTHNLKENEIIAVYRKDDYGVPELGSNSKKIGDTMVVRDVGTMGYYDMETDELITDLQNFKGDFYQKPLEYIDTEYTVVGLVTIPNSIGYRSYFRGEEIFILTSKYMTRNTLGFSPMNLILDVDESSILSVTDAITKYTTNINPNLDFESRDTLKQQFYSFKNMFLMVGGLLSIVLGFIGVLNFLNVILTSINTRKTEFAMLQSIGMTGKQLKQMLTFESMSYIVFTLLVSTALTILTMPLLTDILSGMFWFYESRITILPIICVTPILLLISVLVPRLLYKNIQKKSIVERLREIH